MKSSSGKRRDVGGTSEVCVLSDLLLAQPNRCGFPTGHTAIPLKLTGNLQKAYVFRNPYNPHTRWQCVFRSTPPGDSAFNLMRWENARNE